MANPWFKFYGTEYLGDQKMLALTACERSCWITLLCYASQNNGVVRHLDEVTLMQQAGVNFKEDEWDITTGVLEHFESLGMIKIEKNGSIKVRNWSKRQESLLTNAERQARFRERKNSNAKVTGQSYESNARTDKNRIDKKREEESPLASLSYLKTIPHEDIKEFTSRFEVNEKQVKSKAEDLLNWCYSNGKRKKNYRLFLLNALKKDFSERPEEDRNRIITRVKLDEDGSPIVINGIVQMETV